MSLVFLALLVLLAPAALAEDGEPVEVVYFYELGCPHCAHVEGVLDDLQELYPGFVVHKYDIHSPADRSILQRLLAAYGADIGPVPMVFVGDVAMVGTTFYGLNPEPTDYPGPAQDFALEEAIGLALAESASFPLARLPDTVAELVLFTSEGDYASAELTDLAFHLVDTFPRVGLRIYDSSEPENRKLLERLLRLYDARGEAPALIVGDLALTADKAFVRRQDARPFSFTREDKAYVEQQVSLAVDRQAGSPMDRLRLQEQLTLWAVVGAAALDSVNPCDFAVLVLLLGTLLVIGKRGKVIWAGLAFTAGIFIAYYLMGFLLYSILGITVGTRGFRVPFIYAVSALAILVGLWEMKDLLWYGKWFSIEVPERWKPKVKALTSSAVTIPGAFAVGVLDSLFLAPCTSGPYLAILTLLSQTTDRFQGGMLLLLYNLIFVLPMIGITLLVHFGFTTTARAERWRTAKLGKLHFVTGVVMLLLGAGMIAGVRLGFL